MSAPSHLFAFALVVAGLGGCSLPSNETGEALSRTGEMVALSGADGGARAACFTCHGLRGEGDGVAIPRLAGLEAGYLHKQLEDYASGLRPDDAMGPIAKRLDPEQRRAVAAWYSAMPVAPGATASGAPPDVWLRGDPSRRIAACAACHGATGLGVGRGGPVLAGQPEAYTVEQIRRWRKGERRNDPRSVMAQAVAGLTEAEIRATGRWLARRSASQAPDTAVASASASVSAAARPAPLHEARRPDR